MGNFFFFLENISEFLIIENILTFYLQFPICSNSMGGPLMQSFRSCSSFKLLPYLPRTYIRSELYGMPKIRDACDVVIFLFHTCCNASVSSALVHDLGGPPRGAECWPFGRLTVKYKHTNVKMPLKQLFFDWSTYISFWGRADDADDDDPAEDSAGPAFPWGDCTFWRDRRGQAANPSRTL